MNDIQKELYEIFLETKRVCQLLNLKLIAAGGTLLGAVRHKGFIPWDNDMDFYILREEYDRFCKNAPKLLNNQFFLQTHKTENDYYYPFAKVRKNGTTAIENLFKYSKIHNGIWIDIFPLDIVSPNNEQLVIDCKIGRKLIRRIFCHYFFQNRKEYTDIFKKIKYILLNLKIYWKIIITNPLINVAYNKINKISIRYNKVSGSQYIGTFFGYIFSNNLIFNVNDFNDYIEIPFEDSKILVNKNFDHVLTTQYLNWRVIPPKSKQNGGNHEMFAISPSIDYKDYFSKYKN